MKSLPDKYFDLTIADAPYEIERFKRGSLRIAKGDRYKNGIAWDKAPTNEVFDEMFRVSKHCIIWGANNFVLPKTEYFLVWNKEQTVDNFASLEYAWTNCRVPAKMFTYSIHKCMAERKAEGGKIHPCQKPVALYAWILDNYAKVGDRIFDPYLGSGSSRIAAYKKGFDFYACELDVEYFNAQEERFRRESLGEVKQSDGVIVKQQSLFF
jgi:site-specific DNA-methyltransferase (adenine-specific)